VRLAERPVATSRSAFVHGGRVLRRPWRSALRWQCWCSSSPGGARPSGCCTAPTGAASCRPEAREVLVRSHAATVPVGIDGESVQPDTTVRCTTRAAGAPGVGRDLGLVRGRSSTAPPLPVRTRRPRRRIIPPAGDRTDVCSSSEGDASLSGSPRPCTGVPPRHTARRKTSPGRPGGNPMMLLAVMLPRGAGRRRARTWGRDVRPLLSGVTALRPVPCSVAPSGNRALGDGRSGSEAAFDRQGSGRPTEGGGGPWMSR
jgi:hypothetical protein